MYQCPQQIVYTIKQGDSLYTIAKYHKTTIESILDMNANINPYILQPGSKIRLCPGEEFTMEPEIPEMTHCIKCNEQLALSNDMRQAWLQHVYWTRMLIISIVERLADAPEVANRLLENPYDIASIFGRYYSKDVADLIQKLLTEHLQIGAAIITAARDENQEEVDRLNIMWYENADEMADAFSSINPYYNREMVQQMLYQHLSLLTEELNKRIMGYYNEDIDAFNEGEREAMAMADYFVTGIMRQFPQDFM